MRHIVPQSGEPALEFDGVILARASSEASYKRYWTELGLFKTEAGRYIVEIVGNTRVPGKLVVRAAAVCQTEHEMIEHLRRRDSASFSLLALTLLERAAVQDQAIADALDSLEAKRRQVD